MPTRFKSKVRVTLRAPKGAILDEQYSMATLYQSTLDEWVLGGDLRAS